jgi:hypothetical protein
MQRPRRYRPKYAKYGHEYGDELTIPHNWGTGLGEGLDYLDADTRHSVYEAISIADDAVEDTLYGRTP